MRTSYSALQTFGQCPQRYKFQVIEKVPSKKSKEAIFGTLVHSALEHMFSNDPVFPTLEEVVVQFTTKLHSSTFPKSEVARFEKLGIDLIEKYYKKNPPWNFTPIGLETFFEIQIEDPDAPEGTEPHRIAGKIDRLDKCADGTVEVIDYKTSRRLPSQTDVDGDFQLSIYQQAVLHRWPKLKPEQITLSLYFLRASEKISTTKSVKQAESAKAYIVNRIHDIEEATKSNSFPPKPTPLCEWCSYKPICPAWRHLYKTTKPEEFTPTEKEAQEIAKKYIELKSDQDRIKKELVELAQKIHIYLDSENLERLFDDMGTISRSSFERSSWNMESAAEILKEENKLDEILSPDEKKFKELLSSLPKPLVEKLHEISETKKTVITLKVGKALPKPETPEE